MSRSLSLVSVGSCPTFQSESGHLGGILMGGFVLINFCVDHWILGVGVLGFTPAVLLSNTSVAACV